MRRFQLLSYALRHVNHANTVARASLHGLHSLQAPNSKATTFSAWDVLPRWGPTFGTRYIYQPPCLTEPVKSLQFDRGGVEVPPLLDNWLGRFVVTSLGVYTRRSHITRGAFAAYDAVLEVSTSAKVFEVFGLDKTRLFHLYALAGLYIWMLGYRLGTAGKEGKAFMDRLFYQFCEDAAIRVYNEGVEYGASKWTTNLEKYWFKSSQAFTQCLSCEPGSSPPLVDLLWQYIYDSEPGKEVYAELLAKYIVREIKCLGDTDAEAVLSGHIKFTDPAAHLRKKKAPTAAAAAPEETQAQ